MSASLALRRFATPAQYTLIAATLLLTLSRAWRLPNDFAEAHWLLDYRFGFVKRGLAGQVLSSVTRLFHTKPTAAIISAIAIVLLVMLALAMLWVARDMIRLSAQQEAAALVALTFVSSPFIVMSAHLIGYLDGIVILLTTAAVALMLTGRGWMAGIAQATAVLVHESAILVGFPVLCLAWWLSKTRTAATLVLPVIAFLALAVTAGRLPSDFQQDYSLHLMNYPFVGGDMHVFVPEWLTPGFAQHFAEQKHHFAERIASDPMLGLVVPSVFVLLAWTIDASRLRTRSMTLALVVGVILAPQVMHLAAWDTMRIWTYSIVMAWLVAWTMARSAGAGGHISSGVRLLALLALLVNVIATTFLLDNQTDHYSFGVRLLLFAPSLVGALVLFLRAGPSPAPRLE